MKKTLFTTLAIAGMYISSHAQITYHDINPDTTVNTWNVFSVIPNPSTTSNTLDIWWHPSPEVVVTTWGDVQLLFDAAGTNPAKLNAGDSIGATATWKTASYLPLNSAGTGNWTSNATDKYLGFKIKNGSTWNYGWLKMTVATGAASFTVKEWAFNTAGTSIKAGQSTTTGITNAARNTEVKMELANKSVKFDGLPGDNNLLQVFDMNGRRLKTASTGNRQATDLSELNSGYYILNITSGDYNQFFKVYMQ